MIKTYDLLLRGGRVIDPAQRLDGPFDVAIRQDRIAAVEPTIEPSLASEVIDVRGQLVLPGMIDPHAHVFRHMTGMLGMEADWVGVQSGVTTLIEQGGVSAATLPGFNEYVVKAKANRVFAYLAPYVAGGVGGFLYPDQFTPNTIDVNLTLRAFEKFPSVVRGMKYWAEQSTLLKYGDAPIRKTSEIARAVNAPMYVHLGELWRLPEEIHRQLPAEKVLETILPFVRPGDIFAHAYTDRLGGFFNVDGSVRSIVKEAIAAGVKVDLGYGAATTLSLVRQGLAQGFVPDTLGADIHAMNTDLRDDIVNPRGIGRFGNFPGVVAGMNLLMACGLPLEQVVPMATINPARILLRESDDAGTLRVGAVADVSVLDDQRGKWILRDTSNDQVTTGRLLRPAFCLRAGIRFDANSPFLVEQEQA